MKIMCRCSKCRMRKTLSKRPENYIIDKYIKCYCGGKFAVDEYRNSGKECEYNNKHRKYCNCDLWWFKHKKSNKCKIGLFMIKDLIFFKQDICGNEGDKVGNCFQVCVSILTEISIKKIPHYYDIYRDDPQLAMQKYKLYVEQYGYSMIDLLCNNDNDLKETLNLGKQVFGENCYYILSGQSPSSDVFFHCVICHGDKIIWDPSENEKELRRPEGDQHWIFTGIFINPFI